MVVVATGQNQENQLIRVWGIWPKFPPRLDHFGHKLFGFRRVAMNPRTSGLASGKNVLGVRIRHLHPLPQRTRLYPSQALCSSGLSGTDAVLSAFPARFTHLSCELPKEGYRLLIGLPAGTLEYLVGLPVLDTPVFPAIPPPQSIQAYFVAISRHF